MFNSSPQDRRWASLFYWMALIFIWLASLDFRALITPDEGRYATLAMHMLQTGDFITPRLNGLLYFEKPAFQYWVGAFSFFLFGFTEFAARFWPGLSGLLTVFTVGLTGQALWGKKSGHLAALVCAGCVWIIGNSHFLTLDMGLTFFLTLTLCAFLLAQHDEATPRQRRTMMWLAWVAMAGAVLSKGLVGLLIPGTTLFLYSLTQWHWKPWSRMAWLSGLAIFLALSAPWFWLVSQKNPDFAHFFFIREHFQRFLTTEHSRVGPLWYFVPILLVGFLPWTTFLPRLFFTAWKKTSESFQTQRFILLWCIFIFAFFSKSSSKLPSYILPMFPALSLLLGQLLAQTEVKKIARHFVLPALFWLAVLIASFWIVDLADIPQETALYFGKFLIAAAVVFLVGTVIAWRLLRVQSATAGIMAITMASVLSLLIATSGHEAYGQFKSSQGIVVALSPYLNEHPNAPVYAVRNYDQSLPYYLRRPVTLVEYTDEFSFGEKAEPERWIPTVTEFKLRWQQEPAAVAYMDQQTFQALEKEKLLMKIVYQDVYRMVVVKP